MCIPQEQAILLVLDELADQERLLTQWSAAVKEEAETREDETEEEAEALTTLFLELGWQLSPDEPMPLSQGQRHALVQLRLLAALTTTEPAVAAVDPVEAPRTPNLTTEGLSAPHSALDGLLTIACGAIQLATGVHLLGGIAAILHGAGRLTAPDSLFTKAMSTVRKALTPDVTVIQESVKMMAPLPDNEGSGLRDTLCLAAHEITGLELGALKHQLFAPEEAKVSRRDLDLDQVSEQELSYDSIGLPPPRPPHEIQEPETDPTPDPPGERGINGLDF